MRAPFSAGLRIGTDIVSVHRILGPLQPDIARAARLADRYLLPAELGELHRRYPKWDAPHSTIADKRHGPVAAWLAGRWAAKEAAKKAWDASLLGFRDLIVEVLPEGGVQIVCGIGQTTSPSDSTTLDKITEQVAQLSISHHGAYSIATVLAEPLHPDIRAELGRRKTEAERKVSPSYKNEHESAAV
jgi:phosphopantetheine--protein transferase-like protein